MKNTGKGGITATIIKDSISQFGDRITTFELEYPRFIHGELMTHRMFSRNAMSSRAVPVSKMIEQVRTNPAMPIHWGKNQAGMQANLELDGIELFETKASWLEASQEACMKADNMVDFGAHKQVVNRILEPFQMMKTIVTATEYANFFSLRCHEDAQPEIHELAGLMSDIMNNSEPDLLRAGEWHVPYVDRGECGYFIVTPDFEGEPLLTPLSLKEALKVSASCCAQVSYRLLDNSVEKAIMIYDKLITSKPAHSSPMEHQAQVMGDKDFDFVGVTHRDMDGHYWSGNFKGWIQYRQLL